MLKVLKRAVFAPMPTAIVRTATSVKPGDLSNERAAYLRSGMGADQQVMCQRGERHNRQTPNGLGWTD